jgi:CRISPR/Cas system-associated exonuclease Cas4 (RecB family)
MNLPDELVFSQSSLQDFVDCRRRFQLRYILRLQWPAIQAAPTLENEQLLQLGARFHRLVQQYLTGLPEQQLAATAGEEKSLEQWWHNFIASVGRLPEIAAYAWDDLQLFPELVLTAGLAGQRLLAKYDLVVRTPDGKLVILDWKTSQRRPKKTTLAARWQTRLYPYLLVRAGAWLNEGQPVTPESIVMVYWFAAFPNEPQVFSYNRAKFQRDQEELEAILTEIQRLPPDGFPLTTEPRRCEYCQYRSLCDRGIAAGNLEEADPDDLESGFSLDLEAIAEIGYD